MTVITATGQLVWISADDVLDALTRFDRSGAGALYGRAIHSVRELRRCHYVAFKLAERVQVN